MEGNNSNNNSDISIEDSRTNLIINYLPQTLSDPEFKSLFLSIGPIKSCKIVRHKATGYSYGFGFVDYTTPIDAMRAIQTLNGFQIQNKKIKVAYARPSSDNIKNANLYIRGLPKDMSEQEFQKIFAVCGSIIQCRVLKDDITGEGKGVGFILYDLRDQAELAIEKFGGQTLPGGGEPLSIRFAEDNAKKVRPPVAAITHFTASVRSSYSGGGPIRQIGNRYRYSPMLGNYGGSSGGGLTISEAGHILFVYNIGADTDEKTLWQLFAQYGSILKVNIIRDSTTGAGKGYGFVTMAKYDDAIWAIEALNGYQFAGRPLQVSFKTPKM